MDEKKWRRSLLIASVVAREVSEKKLDLVKDRDRIKAMIMGLTENFEKIQEIIGKFSREIRTHGQPNSAFCENFGHFLTNLNQMNQQVFFLLAIEAIDIQTLRRFLERYGVIIREEIIREERPGILPFETLAVVIPGNMFLYIKYNNEILDFDSNLFEELAEIYTNNIGGTDVSIKSKRGVSIDAGN